MTRHLLPLLLAALAAPAAAAECGAPDAPCTVEGGSYLALPPPSWDGTAPLPAAVFFHGYAQTAQNVADNAALVAAFADAGVLLLVPDGVNRTWAHVGSPSRARDELAFLDAVRADALARFAIDEERLYVTGFSQGGSMAWDVACYRGDDYRAFMPFAGAFWRPHPDACPSGPVNLRHVHGTDDPVVPMQGRAIREVYRQGDVREGMALWREHNACPAEPERVREDGLACEVWRGCAGGSELRLCLHDGGHSMPAKWVAEALAWARRVSG